MKNLRIIILTLFVIVFSPNLFGDELVLKTGKKYKGRISRTDDGKLSIKTRDMSMAFPESRIDLKRTKFSSPKITEQKKVSELLKEKKYFEAKPIFKKWEKRYQNLPTPWFEKSLHGLGLCLANSGDSAAGVIYFKKLLEKFPKTRFKNDAEFWIMESQLGGDIGAEQVEKMKGLLSDPKTSERIRAKTLKGLAGYYESEKKIEEALEQYASILVLYGDQEELQENATKKCAELFEKIGRTNEAAFYRKQMKEME